MMNQSINRQTEIQKGKCLGLGQTAKSLNLIKVAFTRTVLACIVILGQVRYLFPLIMLVTNVKGQIKLVINESGDLSMLRGPGLASLLRCSMPVSELAQSIDVCEWRSRA